MSSKEGTTIAPVSSLMRRAIAMRSSLRAVVGDDLGALRSRHRALHGRRVGGHDDGGGDAEAAGGDGDPPGVIAGRESDDAAFPFFFSKLQEAVGGASQLERAALLKAFGLCPEPPALPVEREQRRAGDPRRDAIGGGNDPGAGGEAWLFHKQSLRAAQPGGNPSPAGELDCFAFGSQPLNRRPTKLQFSASKQRLSDTAHRAPAL
jgi:hypothetical protein